MSDIWFVAWCLLALILAVLSAPAVVCAIAVTIGCAAVPIMLFKGHPRP